MAAVTTLLSAVKTILTTAGMTVYDSYDPVPRDARTAAPFCVLGAGTIAGGLPDDAQGGVVYPLQVGLELLLLAPQDAAPALLLDAFETQVLGPLLDGGYALTQLRVEPPAFSRTHERLVLHAVLTLGCGYTRGEESA